MLPLVLKFRKLLTNRPTQPMKRKKLTGKQELFCQEYLIDLNATAAATRAKYSPKTATEAGSENLRKPHIQKRIGELREEAQKTTGITKEVVLENLLRAINISEAKLNTAIIGTDEKGRPVSIDLKKTDLSNFIKANELLMRYLGMFEKENDQKRADSQVSIFQLPDNARD